MAGKKDAAWWRAHRAKKKAEAAAAANIETPNVSRETSPIATPKQGVTEPVTAEPPITPVAPRGQEVVRRMEPQPAPPTLTRAEMMRRLAPAPIDECVSCGHGWHNDEDGCRVPSPRRPCGCVNFLAPGEPPF